MFDFLNNPWETEEQKHQRTDNARMQMPYNPGQPQMTPQQIVEQTWDRSEAEQTAREKELEPMKNMSTHDALGFAWNKQEEKQNMPKVPHLRDDKKNPLGTTCENFLQNTLRINFNNSAMGQLGGTIKDFCNNYIDMLNANLKSSDDEKKEYRTTDNYYHCKANYNAAHRGSVGDTAATILGNAREAVDLPYNYFKKGKTWRESWQDRENDLAINQIGRQRALSNQFKSAQDACAIFKPHSLSEDEEYKKWYR